ncbi:MAG TPA: SDR family oxidoreductase, partial [Candidatus Polarisedimenticolia bacterium]|nr:SDR family oxidoreductase [Candidatus Polarisedimenticolia bacterium]
WRVHAARRTPRADDPISRLDSQKAGSIAVHTLDVTDSAAIAALARELSGEPIDTLLNNAGVYEDRDTAFGAADPEAWVRVLRVNTIAPLKMAEAFVEHVASSRRRLIATISSRMGSIEDNGSGGYYLYRSSKAAANMVVRSLSRDLKPRGIVCVALSPGWVRTDMGGPSAPLSVEQSVTGLRRVMDRLTPADTGRFLEHDGAEVPW